MITKEELKKVLMSLNDTIDYDSEESLVSGGHLDSLMVVSLIVELKKQYGIKIPASAINSDNFDSLDKILDLCTKKA